MSLSILQPPSFKSNNATMQSGNNFVNELCISWGLVNKLRSIGETTLALKAKVFVGICAEAPGSCQPPAKLRQEIDDAMFAFDFEQDPNEDLAGTIELLKEGGHT
jgi:hypothetical protein